MADPTDAQVSASILLSVKKVCGIHPTDKSFDVDILLHINTVFSTLSQLGVKPIEGFFIMDESALWTDYLEGNNLLNNVKTYTCLQVRVYFDPPTSSFDLTAKNEMIKELGWRINVAVETPPTP